MGACASFGLPVVDTTKNDDAFTDPTADETTARASTSEDAEDITTSERHSEDNDSTFYKSNTNKLGVYEEEPGVNDADVEDVREEDTKKRDVSGIEETEVSEAAVSGDEDVHDDDIVVHDDDIVGLTEGKEVRENETKKRIARNKEPKVIEAVVIGDEDVHDDAIVGLTEGKEVRTQAAKKDCANVQKTSDENGDEGDKTQDADKPPEIESNNDQAGDDATCTQRSGEEEPNASGSKVEEDHIFDKTKDLWERRHESNAFEQHVECIHTRLSTTKKTALQEETGHLAESGSVKILCIHLVQLLEDYEKQFKDRTKRDIKASNPNLMRTLKSIAIACDVVARDVDAQQVKEDESKEKDDDKRKRVGHDSDDDDEAVVGEKEDDTKVDKTPVNEKPENEKQLEDKEEDQMQQTSQEDGHQENNNQMENSGQEDGKGGGNQTGNRNMDEHPENEKENQEPKDYENQDVPKYEQETGNTQEPNKEEHKNQDGANQEDTKQAKDESRTPERQTVSNAEAKRGDIALLSSGNEGNMETAESIGNDCKDSHQSEKCPDDGINVETGGNPADGGQDNAVENDSPQMTHRPFSEFEGEHLDKTVQLVNDCFDLGSKYESIQLKAVCALAFLVTDADKPELTVKMIPFLLKNLRLALDDTKHEHSGISLLSIQKGVRHLLEMFNKKRLDLLLKHDVLDVLQKGLHGAENDREIEVCIYCLWLLSFNKDCLNKMAAKQVMWQKEIRKAKDSTTCKRDQDKADEILEHIKKHLDHERQKKAKKKQKVPDANLGHVMLSYNWGSQPIVTQIRDFLKAEGINTWMDIPNMTDKKDLLTQRMADAVEGAAIVIIGVTEKYFNSRNCKYEANYAHQEEKPLLFLKLQKNYRPKGWLGFIQSTELFFDFTKEGTGCFDKKSQELLKYIRQILKVPASSKTPDAKENTGTSKKVVTVEHQTPLTAGSGATEAGPSSSETDHAMAKNQSDKEPQQEQRNKNQNKRSDEETTGEVKEGTAPVTVDQNVHEEIDEFSSPVNEEYKRKSDAGVKNKREKHKLGEHSNRDQDKLNLGSEQDGDGEEAGERNRVINAAESNTEQSAERNRVINAAESNTEQSNEEKEESETNASEGDEQGQELSRKKQDKEQNRTKMGDIATEFETKEKKGDLHTEEDEEDENEEVDARLQDREERETNDENIQAGESNIQKKISSLSSTSRSSSEGESPREENQSRTQREGRRQHRSKSKDTGRVCSECKRPYPRHGKERADKPAEKPDGSKSRRKRARRKKDRSPAISDDSPDHSPSRNDKHSTTRRRKNHSHASSDGSPRHSLSHRSPRSARRKKDSSTVSSDNSSSTSSSSQNDGHPSSRRRWVRLEAVSSNSSDDSPSRNDRHPAARKRKDRNRSQAMSSGSSGRSPSRSERPRKDGGEQLLVSDDERATGLSSSVNGRQTHGNASQQLQRRQGTGGTPGILGRSSTAIISGSLRRPYTMRDGGNAGRRTLTAKQRKGIHPPKRSSSLAVRQSLKDRLREFGLKSKELDCLSEKDLRFLLRLKSEAPEIYYNTLSKDLHLHTVSEVAKFSEAMQGATPQASGRSLTVVHYTF
ncbi:myb-like protein X [Littorina saxatilis]|uniref:myb-like protein X n=1 Tax=Littorina saxatilis TaxID=31220 RepID=UPI0038B5979E